MPYRRQRKAAMQVMQNLHQRRGPGKEFLGQSSTLACRQIGCMLICDLDLALIWHVCVRKALFEQDSHEVMDYS